MASCRKRSLRSGESIALSIVGCLRNFVIQYQGFVLFKPIEADQSQRYVNVVVRSLDHRSWSTFRDPSQYP